MATTTQKTLKRETESMCEGLEAAAQKKRGKVLLMAVVATSLLGFVIFFMYK